jgi:vancomycin permeability regulator SanA
MSRHVSPSAFDKIVIVLGNRLISNDLHEEPKGRMDAAIGLWSSLENCLLLVSGGRANSSVPKTECDAMKGYAVMKGVPSDLVIRDPNALDTIGNAYFSRRILDTLPDIKFVYVVTSCYHSPRAEYIFKFCLGPKYILDAKTCYDSGRLTEMPKCDSFDSARSFFSGIAPGSIEEIGIRLREQHSLYRDLVT